jgi:hypothetical protein
MYSKENPCCGKLKALLISRYGTKVWVNKLDSKSLLTY